MSIGALKLISFKIKFYFHSFMNIIDKSFHSGVAWAMLLGQQQQQQTAAAATV